MVSQQEEIFRINRKALILKWLMLLLLFASTIVIPFIIAIDGQIYPDLTIVPIFYSIAGFLWVPLLAEYWRQTISVLVEQTEFIVKKFAQRPKRFNYSDILTYNERLDFAKGDRFNVLTVYLKDDFFIIKSNEFYDYELLKEQLLQYGQSVTYQKVMTLAERNLLRWMIIGLALLIIVNIAFGYVAHNNVDKKPAQLFALTDLVNKVHEDRPKGMLKGVTISLRSYPAFSFYVSRRSYNIRLDPLKSAITTNQPITLLIRESDYRKKIAKTEPLTFGDKYSDYKHISVFGVDQTNSVHLQTSGPVYEPTHTNPLQRTILLSFLLLLCWVGWVYVDRHKVLRAD